MSFINLTSLTLSRESTDSGVVFEELASVLEMFNGTYTKYDVHKLGAEVKGHLVVQGNSYISLEWRSPQTDMSGRYRCQAAGTDSRGKVAVLTDVATVGKDLTDTDVDNISVLLREMGMKLNDFEAWKNNINSRYQNLSPAGFVKSATFRNHTYFLSAPVTINVFAMESTCQIYGSHLVFVNNAEEFQFLTGFIKDANYVKETVALGTWLFLDRPDRLTYFDWAVGQPDGDAEEKCLFLRYDVSGYKMYDDACHAEVFGRFVCETGSL